MSSSPSPPRLLPWGRLVLLSGGHRSSLPDHLNLSRSKHRVGRVANRCDLHIPKNYISGLHSIIIFKGKDSNGEPIVEIEDQSSRYGTWVDRVKIGYRKKAILRKGGVVHFTAPDAKDVTTEIAYRLEILPSGLTQQNEELHARMSADEMSVADRTRKRTHEETQCTQSPTKVVRSPPRPRPVKKVRRVTSSQQSNDEDASEPMGEPDSTPATQSAPDSGSQVPPSASAAGKRRHRPDVPAPDSKLAELKRKYGLIMLDKEFELKSKAEELKSKAEELKKAEQELESVRKENEALKKNHEEELAKVKAEAAAEVKKVKAEAAKQEEASKKELSEVRQERNMLERVVHQVLADPKTPHQVRSVAELETTIVELKRKLQSTQDDLAYGGRDGRPQTTPPSKKRLVETERQQQLTAELELLHRKRAETQQNYSKALSELTDQEGQLTVQMRAAADHSLNLSGSSQSQDSIDSARNRSRRDSQLSNEQSEPSPGDQAQTVDEETKSGDTPQGLPPLFNQYGARSAQARGRPTTLSQSRFYRATQSDEERKTETEEKASEETKGNKLRM